MHDAHTHIALYGMYVWISSPKRSVYYDFWMADMAQKPSRHPNASLITSMHFRFFFSLPLLQFAFALAPFFACSMHFNGTFFLFVNILYRWFESLASCISHRIANVHFSLVITHDMHQRNNRQMEELQWRRFDDIFDFFGCFFFIFFFSNTLFNCHIAVMNWKIDESQCMQYAWNVNKTKRWKRENKWFDQITELFIFVTVLLAEFKATFRRMLAMCHSEWKHNNWPHSSIQHSPRKTSAYQRSKRLK